MADGKGQSISRLNNQGECSVREKIRARKGEKERIGPERFRSSRVCVCK